jgi:hypothetical protein
MKFDDRPVSEQVADMFKEDWERKEDLEKSIDLSIDFDNMITTSDKVKSLFECEEENTIVKNDNPLSTTLDTMDAVAWMEEFMKIRKQAWKESEEDIADDEGTMLGWFANSIMKGYDHGLKVGEENGLELAARKRKEMTQQDSLNLGEQLDVNQSFHERIDSLRSCVGIQSEPGKWDSSEYMMGYANGLILALAIMENEEPWFFTQFPPKEIQKKMSEKERFERAMSLVK